MCFLLTKPRSVEGDTTEPTILTTDGYSLHGSTSEGLALECLLLPALCFQVI